MFTDDINPNNIMISLTDPIVWCYLHESLRFILQLQGVSDMIQDVWSKSLGIRFLKKKLTVKMFDNASRWQCSSTL
jgi:hypothetical protein